MPLPALLWGATKLSLMFYGASKADDALTGGMVKEGGKWGLSKAFDTVAGSLGFERKSEPDATGVTPFKGMPNSHGGNGGQNTQFNSVADGAPEVKEPALLDTITGKVTKPNQENGGGFFENLMSGNISGALMSGFNALTTDKNGESDFINAKTMTLLTAVVGGLFASKNMLNGKGPNSGMMAQLLLVGTVVGGVVLGIDKLKDMQSDSPQMLRSPSADDTRQPSFSSERDIASLSM